MLGRVARASCSARYRWFGVALFCTLLASSTLIAGELDNSRYPAHLPEWIWRYGEVASLIPEKTRRELLADLKQIEILQVLQKDDEADQKLDELGKRISHLFSLHDLVRTATLVADAASGRKLGIQLDSTFPVEMRSVLIEAVAIFLRFALDEEVISKALEISVPEPQPMPQKYVLKDGNKLQDGMGIDVLTDDYQFALRSIAMPLDANAFKVHLGSALAPSRADAPLLVISRYTGNEWWGGGYYNFFHKDKFRLSGSAPDQGFLYIRLNADRMTAQSPRYNDPRFWASKIAHEILHNLGYWHPNYKDPAERDKFNVDGQRAFIVAYETLMLQKADDLIKQ